MAFGCQSDDMAPSRRRTGRGSASLEPPTLILPRGHPQNFATSAIEVIVSVFSNPNTGSWTYRMMFESLSEKSVVILAVTVAMFAVGQLPASQKETLKS